MKNLILLSRKGGVGKSTSSIHFASVLADLGRRVLLSDGDATLSALSWARRAKSPLGFETCDSNNEGEAIGKAYGAGKPFDVVVLDTPAAPDDRKLASLLRREDAVIVMPTPADALSIGGLLDTVADLEHFSRRGETIPPAYVLLTRARTNARREVDQAATMLRGKGVAVLDARIREAQAFPKAALGGAVARDLADRYGEIATGAYKDYARAYEELASRVKGAGK